MLWLYKVAVIIGGYRLTLNLAGDSMVSVLAKAELYGKPVAVTRAGCTGMFYNLQAG